MSFAVRLKLHYLACGGIGHTYHRCFLHGPNFIHITMKRRIEQINKIYGNKPDKPPFEPKFKQLPPSFFKTTDTKPEGKMTIISESATQHFDVEDEQSYDFARDLVHHTITEGCC